MDDTRKTDPADESSVPPIAEGTPAETLAKAGSNNPPVSPQTSSTPPAHVSEPVQHSAPAELPVGHTHELAAHPVPPVPLPATAPASAKPVSPAPTTVPINTAAPLIPRETVAPPVIVPKAQNETPPPIPPLTSIPKVIAPHPIEPSIHAADPIVKPSVVKPAGSVPPITAMPQTSLIHNDMPLPEPLTPDPDAPPVDTSRSPFMGDIANILKGIKLPERFSAKVTGERTDGKIPEPVILSEKIIPAEEKKNEKTAESSAPPHAAAPMSTQSPQKPVDQPKSELPVHAQIQTKESKPIDLPTPSIPAKEEEQKQEKEEPASPTAGQSLISPIRTFKEDLMHIVRDRKISLVRAVALEEDKKSRIRQPSPQEIAAHRQRQRRVVAILFTTGVLIFLGSAALFGVYTIEQKRAALPQVITNVSMIFAEQNLSFPLQDLSASEIKRILSQSRGSSNASLGSITRIVPTLPSIDGSGKMAVRAATTQEFFKAIETTVSESLLRALGSEFFFGIHTVDKNAPLMVIPVLDYEHAFAGMLEWEKSMNTDLAPAFTAVSGFKIDESGLPQQRVFDDIVMRNYDVRTLKDDAGNIILYYSFPTPKVLIIAESPYSFTEILTRLQASRRL